MCKFERGGGTQPSGKRKNGKPLDPFMPVDALRNLNEVELTALWAYLQSAPPRPFGERG